MEELKPKSETGKPPAVVEAIAAFVLTLIIFGGALYLWSQGANQPGPEPGQGPNQPPPPTFDGDVGEVEQFKDQEEFSIWMAAADAKSQHGGVQSFAARGLMVDEAVMDKAAPTTAPDGMGVGLGSGGGAERVSETNVQVAGIDEPDILKTDGQEIYFSPQMNYYPVFRGGGIPESRTMIDVDSGDDEVTTSSRIAPDGIMPEYREPSIKAVMAFPPEDMEQHADIERSGEMLLSDDVLAVFTYDGVYAYDVSDPANPVESWKISYENNNWPVAQRLMDGELYLVLAGGIDRGRPCPFVPLAVSGQEVAIHCADIWHPVRPIPSELTYTVLKVDLATGETSDSTSFLGSYSSTIYMSADNLYVTYQYQAEVFKFITGFLNANTDLVPAYVIERLNKVAAYDISEQSKMTELQDALNKWLQNMDEDEGLRLANEMKNRIDDYYQQHRREMQSTGVVRIALDGLSVAASGVVPGTPLNQFSLDEYDSHLRIATTTGDMGDWFWQFGLGGQLDSINDVYVLDMNLNQVGAALGMGLDERIYSVRFIGDQGYVVTFKQTDPFYVLDLSNPRQPTVTGELKIPGFSSYLHPVREHLILGIGQEDRQVKLSLFDVSNPSAPVEKSKYQLKEYWTDVQNTHHAFLLDDKFDVFFLPGGQGSYIFSLANDKLELVKAVSGLQARRALFLDDYLYVVGDEGIVVLDEVDWSRVNELEFE